MSKHNNIESVSLKDQLSHYSALTLIFMARVMVNNTDNNRERYFHYYRIMQNIVNAMELQSIPLNINLGIFQNRLNMQTDIDNNDQRLSPAFD